MPRPDVSIAMAREFWTGRLTAFANVGMALLDYIDLLEKEIAVLRATTPRHPPALPIVGCACGACKLLRRWQAEDWKELHGS